MDSTRVGLEVRSGTGTSAKNVSNGANGIGDGRGGWR